jgi:hypothetical protein
MEFNDEQMVHNHLLNRLPILAQMDPEWRSHSLDCISSVFKNYELPMSNGREVRHMSYMVPKIYWVIRDEDLPIIESFLAGFASAAAVGFFAPGSADQNRLMTAAAGLIATCYKIYRAVSGKGKFLSQIDYKILLCLKNNDGGLDTHRLLSMLNLTKDTITVIDLENRLKALQTIHTTDGSKRELIFIENQLFKVRGI